METRGRENMIDKADHHYVEDDGADDHDDDDLSHDASDLDNNEDEQTYIMLILEQEFCHGIDDFKNKR